MTANPHRGEVEIELDGKRFVMRPTFQAIAEIEQQTGTGLIALLHRMTDGGLRVSDLAVIIAAGLKAAGEPASRDKVGSLLLQDGLEKTLEPASHFLMNAVTGGRATANGDSSGADAPAGDASGGDAESAGNAETAETR